MKTYLYWIIGILALIALLRSTQIVIASYEIREELKDCQVIANIAIDEVGIAKFLK